MISIVPAVGCAGRASVARLISRCSPAALRARLFLPDGRVLPTNLLDLLVGPADGLGYLAMDGHRPVGLANLAPEHDRDGIDVGLLVADRWRRRGIGRALLRHAMADPRWAGASVHAEVRPRNTAVLGLLRSLQPPVRLLDTAPGEYYFELRPAQRQVRAAG